MQLRNKYTSGENYRYMYADSSKISSYTVLSL